MRRRLLLTLIAVLIAVPTVAAPPDRDAIDRSPARAEGRHFILTPRHVLSDAEQTSLGAEGVRVQRALSQGRYVVRVEPGATIAADDLRIKSLEPYTAAQKLHASAYRAASAGHLQAKVRVFFNEEVDFEQARDAVAAAGGSLAQPLATGFEPLKSVTATIPAASLASFASDERVYSVYGARMPRAKSMNFNAGVQSHVHELHDPPYSLKGEGVVLSYFELAPADTTHKEFEGRLISHIGPCSATDSQCNEKSNQQHATHTAGTQIAAGLDPRAIGMAPKATLHLYRGDAGPWLTTKETGPRDVGSVSDNSSIGYVWGWSQDGSTGWTWNDGDEFIGGYDGTLSAVIDHIAYASDTLYVHASGNEAQYSGPVDGWGVHNHSDDDFNPTTERYCYSANGSGTDCPTTQCTAGPSFCEKVRHPVRSPFGSVNWFASMKNIIAVGAVNSVNSIASFSSRGPAKDGRVKPEMVAKGQTVYSTIDGNAYATSQGTSMSAPVISGTMALLVEQWRKTTGRTGTPGALYLKGLTLATAEDLGLPGPDYTFGFGLFNARAAADLVIADAGNGNGKRVKIDSAAQGSQFDYPITLTSGQNLRVVLSWMDPEVLPIGAEEFAGATLVNDLDLKVVGPGGTTTLPYVLDLTKPTTEATRGVNTVDNNEEVEIKPAAAGTYHVIVSGTRVTAKSPQKFVVVTSADIGAGVPPCVDPTEPNDTIETAYSYLASSIATNARLCAASDVDFFRFLSNATGSASASVTATDTPLRVSLVVNGSTVATTNVAAGQTQVVSTSLASSGTTVYVKIEPNGTLGADGGYTVTATYPLNNPAKRRSTRH